MLVHNRLKIPGEHFDSAMTIDHKAFVNGSCARSSQCTMVVVVDCHHVAWGYDFRVVQQDFQADLCSVDCCLAGEIRWGGFGSEACLRSNASCSATRTEGACPSGTVCCLFWYFLFGYVACVLFCTCLLTFLLEQMICCFCVVFFVLSHQPFALFLRWWLLKLESESFWTP